MITIHPFSFFSAIPEKMRLAYSGKYTMGNVGQNIQKDRRSFHLRRPHNIKSPFRFQEGERKNY